MRFWRSACALMRVADAHGGADWDTRSMIHTIGVSFTAEMALKAAYEETIGRDDGVAARAGEDAAGRGRRGDGGRLCARSCDRRRGTSIRSGARRRSSGHAPVDGSIRGWERRLGIGLEFTAKAAYAKVIAGAVAATAPAQLMIRSVVSGIDAARLLAASPMSLIGVRAETASRSRRRATTCSPRILAEIASQGGDDPRDRRQRRHHGDAHGAGGRRVVRMEPGSVILRMKRDGIPGDRVLVNVKVASLAAFLDSYPLGDPGLEHVFDY